MLQNIHFMLDENEVYGRFLQVNPNSFSGGIFRDLLKRR